MEEFNHELNVDDETIDNAIEIAMDNTHEQLITEVWKMDWIRFKIDLQEEDNKCMYTATSGLLAAKYFNYRHPMPKITQTTDTQRCKNFIEAVNAYGTRDGKWSDNWQAIIKWAKELIKPPGYLKQPSDMLIGINGMDKLNQYRPR